MYEPSVLLLYKIQICTHDTHLYLHHSTQHDRINVLGRCISGSFSFYAFGIRGNKKAASPAAKSKHKKEVTLYLLHLSPTSDKGHFSTFLVSSIIFIPRFLLIRGVPLCGLNIPRRHSLYKMEWCTNCRFCFCAKHRFAHIAHIRTCTTTLNMI